MGQKSFKAAGFDVNFAAVAPKDDPNALTNQHIMVSGSRTITVDGKQKTEIAVISNSRFYSTSQDGKLTPAELNTSRTKLFADALNDLPGFSKWKNVDQSYKHKVMGRIVVAPTVWHVEDELENEIKASQSLPAASSK